MRIPGARASDPEPLLFSEFPKESPSMSAVMDNNASMSSGRAATAITAGTPTPMKKNSNALMDTLFKNLTRLFAFLVFILLAAIMVSLIYGSQESLGKYGL